MINKEHLTHLRQLESESIHILREVTAEVYNKENLLNPWFILGGN